MIAFFPAAYFENKNNTTRLFDCYFYEIPFCGWNAAADEMNDDGSEIFLFMFLKPLSLSDERWNQSSHGRCVTLTGGNVDYR